MLPQCRTHAQFINDYIADHSVRHVAAGDGAGSGVADGGWEWCFDPLKMQKLGALANPSPKLGAQAFDQTRLSSSGDDNTGTEPGNPLQYLSVETVRALDLKLSFVVGETSALMDAGILGYNRLLLGDEIAIVEIRNAAHHIMVDQPLALVAAIETTLAEWRRSVLAAPGGGRSLPRNEERTMHSNFDVHDVPKLKWSAGQHSGPKSKL
jgi:hypothetical protein